MNRICLASGCLCLTIGLLLPGCSRKTDVKSELEKTAALMAQGDNSPPPAAPVPQAQPAQPTPTVESPGQVPVAALSEPSDSQQMQAAIAAYNSGQLEDAIKQLQKLRRSGTLTAEQRMALQDSLAAVMTQVYTMAEKGDPRAIQAVQKYEEMQTAPRP